MVHADDADLLKRGDAALVVANTCPEDCGYRRAVFGLLVVAQVLIAAVMIVQLAPPWDHPVTMFLALSGIAIGAWAMVTMGRKTLNISPTVRPEAQLVVRGPYRFVRHPMYTAMLLFSGAYAIRDDSMFGLQLWIGLAIVLAIKMAYEELLLKRRFSEYLNYASRVKRLIPFLF